MGAALSLMPETPGPPPPPGAVFDGKIARLAPLTVTIDNYGERHEWEPCVWIGRGDPPARGVAVAVIRSDGGTYYIAGDVVATVDLGALADAVLERMWTTGDVRHTLRATAASGWLIANGAAVTTTYQDLRALLLAQSSPWGTSGGDPQLPDLRGRALVGAGTGAGLTARALGDLPGTETHTLTTAQMPSHAHQQITGLGVGARAAFWDGVGHADYGDGDTGPTGGDGSHPNMQPSAAVNIEVKT